MSKCNKIGPVKVRGYTKETLKRYREDGFGSPISIHQEIGVKQWGYIGLSPDQRETLDVEIFELHDVIRGDIEKALPIKLIITPGRDNLVSLTGTARKKLGLENYKGVDGDNVVGDIVNIVRDQDGFLVISVVDIQGDINEYLNEAGGSWK